MAGIRKEHLLTRHVNIRLSDTQVLLFFKSKQENLYTRKAQNSTLSTTYGEIRFP